MAWNRWWLLCDLLKWEQKSFCKKFIHIVEAVRLILWRIWWLCGVLTRCRVVWKSCLSRGPLLARHLLASGRHVAAETGRWENCGLDCVRDLRLQRRDVKWWRSSGSEMSQLSAARVRSSSFKSQRAECESSKVKNFGVHECLGVYSLHDNGAAVSTVTGVYSLHNNRLTASRS